MSLRVLLREYPQRSIALVTETHALILRHSPVSQSQSSILKAPLPRCMVEFSARSFVNLQDYRPLHPQGVYGTLGLININADVFLCVITRAISVSTVRAGETVQRIVSVEFHCLNRNDYGLVQHGEGTFYDVNDPSADTFDNHNPDLRDSTTEHPCLAINRMLRDGTFYYSSEFDLTNRLQDRASEESAFDVDSLDESFLWNSYLIYPLIQFRSRLSPNDKALLDASRILTSAIRGYVSSVTIAASSSPLKGLVSNMPSSLTLISRLSCRRAGTRFNARGIDDDGNVANFVETETIYWYPSGLCFSYAQVRGSVPVFWEQATGLLPHQQKIQITRSAEATQPAFDKHFGDLELEYGTIHVLNLLSESRPGEIELTDRYKRHIRQYPANQGLLNGAEADHRVLQESQFDFHAETKGPGGYEAASMVRHLIQSQADGFAYFLSDTVEETDPRSKKATRRAMVILQQEGAFRTNCLDCLDRTNLIQTIISAMAIEAFLGHRGEHALPDFWMKHSTLWADNGDALSRIYAGTGALKSSFTRHGKMSFAGAIADARKSATRLYINNFADKGRQNTIDVLLGRLVDQSPVQLHDPINDYVAAELNRRVSEYSRSESISIWVGTFNLNGKGRGTKEDLSAWLCPEINRSQGSADVVAVGFQEIVELSPQQIMSTDPDRRQEWEIAVGRTLNEDARKRKSEEYVLLQTGQLVGAALMIFVKSAALRSIKNVEGSVKKTGLSGMAGNKGAVAIRFEFASTRLCFITAHLAAGFANYDERNRDYRTISHGLRFQRNRSIEDHDSILWLGDFNYRVGLDNEKVRRLINAGDLSTLYQNDQLNLQMVAGHAFPYYSEARITFLPTYKYNNGTDEYDTSEKSRIPAWCDRVLRKGDNLRQINYNTAPLRFSDHRPVYATFQCTISVVDESLKENLSREVYSKRRGEVGDATANAPSSDVDDEEVLGYLPIAPGLQPASSDRQKWWLKNGLPVRSEIAGGRVGYMPNPQRPSNPFTASPQPDFVPRNGTRNIQKGQNRPPSPDMVHGVTPPLAGRGQDASMPRGHSNPAQTLSIASLVPSTGFARKPAPPVPKKPTLLASTTTGSTIDSARGPGLTGFKVEDGLNKSKTISTRSNQAPVLDTGSPPPPHKTGETPAKLIRQPRGTRSQGAARRPVMQDFQKATVLGNGLMDEDDHGAGSIPSLQPLRPS